MVITPQRAGGRDVQATQAPGLVVPSKDLRKHVLMPDGSFLQEKGTTTLARVTGDPVPGFGGDELVISRRS